jgi:hypothetical protein
MGCFLSLTGCCNESVWSIISTIVSYCLAGGDGKRQQYTQTTEWVDKLKGERLPLPGAAVLPHRGLQELQRSPGLLPS